MKSTRTLGIIDFKTDKKSLRSISEFITVNRRFITVNIDRTVKLFQAVFTDNINRHPGLVHDIAICMSDPHDDRFFAR